MDGFSSCAGTYPNAIALIDRLKIAGIESNITAGGVAISCEPNQVNIAQGICQEMGASFDAGYTRHQEDLLATTPDGYEHLKQITGDAISVIKEWKDD